MIQLLLVILLTSLPGSANDVAKVENEIEPKGKKMTLVFEKELSVASDEGDDERIAWTGSNQQVMVDARGHMFVLDQRDNRILELDRKGSFVRAIGGTGDGPGEFRSLVGFQIFPDQTAIAFENAGFNTTITGYDANWTFRERKKLTNLDSAPRNGTFSPDRRWLAATTTHIDPQRAVEITEFRILDDQFKLVKKMLNWESIMLNPQKVTDTNHWAEFLGQRFHSLSKGYAVYCTFDDKGNMYSARADRYEITRWSSDLKQTLTFGRKYKAIPFTDAEVDAYVMPIRESLLGQLPTHLQNLITVNLVRRATELAGFPPVHFPVGGLLVLPDGTPIVIHHVNPLTRMATGDIFSKKGTYLGSFTFPNNGLQRMVFTKDHAYTIETTDEDIDTLVRYRYRLTQAP